MIDILALAARVVAAAGVSPQVRVVEFEFTGRRCILRAVAESTAAW